MNASSPRAGHSLGRQATSGALWILLQSLTGRVIQLGSQLVLAWTLAPGDFGLAAVVIGVSAVPNLLVTFGIDEFLVQRSRSIRYWLPDGLRLSAVLGCAVGIVLFALGPLISRLYHQDLTLLIWLIAIAAPFTALSCVPAALVRARLAFRTLAFISFAELALTQGLTILFAFNHCGPLSFILPIPMVAAAKAALLWTIARPHQAGLAPRRSRWRTLLFNGSPALGVRMINVAIAQGDYLVLGLVAAPAAVGVYYFAYSIAAQSLRMLAGSMSSVLFPALSRLRSEPVRQYDAALRACRLVASLVMPACFLQAALAGPLLLFIFGEKWRAAIPMVQLLSLALAFDTVSWVSGAFLHARGEFRNSLRYAMSLAVAFFAFISVGAVLGGNVGVAMAVLAYSAICNPIYTYMVFRKGGYSFGQILAVHALPVGMSAVSMGMAYLVATHFWGESRLDLFLRIAVTCALGGGLYLALLFGLSRTVAMDFVARGRAMWRRTA
jgi:O-antigen/teichoic acid export membrane protein